MSAHFASRMATPLQTKTAPSPYYLQRVSWKHDAIIDFILEAGAKGGKVTQNDICAHFGLSTAWVSIVINSDVFQARLAERKTEVLDPLIRKDFEAAVEGLYGQAVEILRQELEKKPTFDAALAVFKASGKNLGLGAKPSVTVNVGENSLISVLSGIQGPTPERVIENGSDSAD